MYLWIKALHIISVISWMAAMLYLPRLYVYHHATKPGSEASEMLKTMERKLLHFIMTPAMIATFIFGIWLVALMGMDGFRTQGWLHGKILLVLILAGLHGALAKWRKDFALEARPKSEKFFRIINEVPAVLIILIVILAVVKPF